VVRLISKELVEDNSGEEKHLLGIDFERVWLERKKSGPSERLGRRGD